jgi:hypothetical protein
MRFCTAGSASASTTAALSLAMTVFGVPLGARLVESEESEGSSYEARGGGGLELERYLMAVRSGMFLDRPPSSLV